MPLPLAAPAEPLLEGPSGSSSQTVGAAPPRKPPAPARLIAIIALGALLIAGLCVGLYLRAAARTNHVALSAAPRPVSVVRAEQASYRASRTYVGVLAPWVTARVGPQYVSAYVADVLVRPGDSVRANQVMATLDCRGSAAASRASAAQARAIGERQSALSHEAARLKQMMAGGFTSQNEVEQVTARSSAEAAELEGQRAAMAEKTLQVDDCVLRAPFAGEVAERFVDPGGYVRPGSAIASVINRDKIRVVASAPEADYEVVAPGTEVALLVSATAAKRSAQVSRRAPAADGSTRTVDFEVDIENPDHALPGGTTAVLTVHTGAGRAASRVPSSAATLRGDKATLFVVTDNVARRRIIQVMGEADGQLFLDPDKLPAGTLIVTEGRALLEDGDGVAAREIAP